MVGVGGSGMASDVARQEIGGHRHRGTRRVPSRPGLVVACGHGYPSGVEGGGIALLDQVWFERLV